MKKNVKKEIYKVLGTIAMIMLAAVVPAMHSKCMTQAEYNRYNELTAQGYSPEVAWDQVQEEFHAMDGPFGTGGLDGQLLSSKPSGGGSGGGSGSGGSGGSGGGGQKPAHTHEYAEEITKEPTCTEDGLRTYKCKCGASYTEVIPAYGHDYQIDQSKHTDATCTAQATETFVCADCGDSFVQPYGELAPHNYQLAGDGKEATCTEAGKSHWVCSACGDGYFEDLDPLGHDWNNEYVVEKNATCTERGMKDIRCNRCGEVKPDSEVIIEALGHVENPNHDVTEATLFKDGKEVITCVTCGVIISETVLPKKMNVTAVIIACCVVAVVALLLVVICTNKKKSGNAEKGN